MCVCVCHDLAYFENEHSKSKVLGHMTAQHLILISTSDIIILEAITYHFQSDLHSHSALQLLMFTLYRLSHRKTLLWQGHAIILFSLVFLNSGENKFAQREFTHLPNAGHSNTSAELTEHLST